ncbi:MAG: hypothetical protein WCK67_04160 [bacterium]
MLINSLNLSFKGIQRETNLRTKEVVCLKQTSQEEDQALIAQTTIDLNGIPIGDDDKVLVSNKKGISVLAVTNHGDSLVISEKRKKIYDIDSNTNFKRDEFKTETILNIEEIKKIPEIIIKNFVSSIKENTPNAILPDWILNK